MTALSFPTGTVTFLFTDVEGSTRLLQQLGEPFRQALERHIDLISAAVRDSGGLVVRTEGDGVFAVFEQASSGVAAAAEAQRALASEEWPRGGRIRARMGLHTGAGIASGDDYAGIDVHRAARIAGAGHGGQVLLSSSTTALVEDALVDGLSLRPLGRHRLKDLERPEEIFQLDVAGLETAFPSLRARQAASNLPLQRTSFVGREREKTEVQERLSPGSVVTLLGPGGTGKTRLAVEVAVASADRFDDGVVFVDLAPVEDPGLVPSTVSAAVGIAEHPDRSVEDLLAEHVRGRMLLFVLDNFEHVVEAAPLVQRLCASGSATFLVTSRMPLRISAEQRFPLGGLVADTSEAAAVRLFVDRARAMNPGFEPTAQQLEEIAEICDRLDGLPLAIELAASRIATMPLGMLRDRLVRRLGTLTGGARDLPERQRTLRDAIAWSYDLLDEDERTVFRRLGAFVGGWGAESLRPVVDPDGSLGAEPLDTMDSLVEKNLVRTALGAEPRWGMLETIREFAVEQLESDEEADTVRARHADHFLGLAEEAAPHLTGLDQAVWLNRLESDQDNFRAVFRWSLATGRVEIGMRIGSALWRFWQLRGRLIEGRDWMEQLLDHPGATERNAVRGHALATLGSLAYWQGDVAAVRRFYTESRDVFEDLGDQPALAHAYYLLAYVPAMEDDAENANRAFGEALRRYEALGDEEGVAVVRMSIGYLGGRLRENYGEALPQVEKAYEYFDRVGRKFDALDALGMVSEAKLRLGRIEEAREDMLRGLNERVALGNSTGVVQALWGICQLALAEGKHDRALRLDGAAAALASSLGGTIPRHMTGFDDPRVVLEGSVDREEIEARWQEGFAMSFEETIEYARARD